MSTLRWCVRRIVERISTKECTHQAYCNDVLETSYIGIEHKCCQYDKICIRHQQSGSLPKVCFEVLTVIPTNTFDQSDPRVYPRCNKQCNEYETQYIACRLLISGADRIDKVARHTWWRRSLWYHILIAHSRQIPYGVWITGRRAEKRWVEVWLNRIYEKKGTLLVQGNSSFVYLPWARREQDPWRDIQVCVNCITKCHPATKLTRMYEE